MNNERKVEQIMSIKNANLIVDYFWDNHGEEVDWNDYTKQPTVFNNADVVINRLTIYQQVLDKVFEFESNQLVVNSTVISGDTTCVEVDLNNSGDLTVYCKVTVGWG